MEGKTPLLVRAGVCAAALLLAGRAHGQVLPDPFPAALPGYGTDPGVTVQSRLRPQYDPLGIRAGGALIHPSLEETLGYDSNLLGARGGSSLVVRTHPSVFASGAAGDESYGLFLDLANTQTPALPAQARTDGIAALGLTRPAGDGKLTLGASHLSLHQDATDLAALPTDKPTPFRVEEVRLSYSQNWNRISLEPRVSLAAWRFGTATLDGLPVSQGYRNRDVLTLGATLGYEMAPRRRLVLDVRGIGQTYPDTPSGSPAEDSRSVTILAGIDDAGDGLWHYRLLGGWERRGFRYPGFRAHSAAVAEGDAIFTPDGMTTLTATLVRGIEDAAQEGVAGYVYTAARLTADYEWRRNVILQAYGGVQRADLLGGGGRQTALKAGVSAAWLLNRRLRLIGSYDLADVRSAGGNAAIAGSFVRSLYLMTVRVGL